MTRTQNSLGLGLALLTALSLTAFNTHHESGTANTAVSIDRKRAAKVFDGQNSESVPLPDLLRAALTVQNDGDPVALVLFAFELKEGRTISKFQSKAFTAPSGRPWLLPAGYQPGKKFYQNNPRVSLDGLTTTKKTIPVDVGVAEPGKFIVNGIFANKPEGWERMNAFYFIVAPAGSKGSGLTSPAALFVMIIPVENP